MKSIGMFSIRGGVGKSTLAVAFAKVLSRRGKAVLIDACSGSRSLDLLCKSEDVSFDNWSDIDFKSTQEIAVKLDFDLINAPAAYIYLDKESPLFKLDMSVYDYAIYDFGNLSETEIKSAVELVDCAIIVSRPDIDSIRMAEKQELLLRKAGQFKVSLLLNGRYDHKYDDRSNLSVEMIKELLEMPIAGDVLYNREMVIQLPEIGESEYLEYDRIIDAVLNSEENIVDRNEDSFLVRLRRYFSGK